MAKSVMAISNIKSIFNEMRGLAGILNSEATAAKKLPSRRFDDTSIYQYLNDKFPELDKKEFLSKFEVTPTTLNDKLAYVIQDWMGDLQIVVSETDCICQLTLYKYTTIEDDVAAEEIKGRFMKLFKWAFIMFNTKVKQSLPIGKWTTGTLKVDDTIYYNMNKLLEYIDVKYNDTFKIGGFTVINHTGDENPYIEVLSTMDNVIYSLDLNPTNTVRFEVVCNNPEKRITTGKSIIGGLDSLFADLYGDTPYEPDEGMLGMPMNPSRVTYDAIFSILVGKTLRIEQYLITRDKDVVSGNAQFIVTRDNRVGLFVTKAGCQFKSHVIKDNPSVMEF